MKKRKILTYEDIIDVLPGSSDEPLVAVQTYDRSIIAQYEKYDMIPYLGADIVVRRTLAKKLARLNEQLESKYQLRLKIVYGYRHPQIQQQYFDARRAVLAKENPGIVAIKLDELTHSFVAIPSIAGHPTGGAIDVTLVDRQGEIDMGTAIADYSDPSKIRTFSTRCTRQQKKNRQILLNAMLSQGFAPFYGEWWHFSYGDREWAAFYDIPSALYGTVDKRLPLAILTTAGGNATAIQIVDGTYPKDIYATVGKSLVETLQQYGVEQVGFLQLDEARFEMAGGEFCGNATSAAAVMLSRFSNRPSVTLGTSGFEGSVTSMVKQLDNSRYNVATTFAGMACTVTSQVIDGLPVAIVDLGGIIHVLVNGALPDEYKTIHQNLVRKLGISNRDAVGVIWFKLLSDKAVVIHPVVWVKAVRTFFYETSCGSGSMAVAIVTKRSLIQQPTGQTITITINGDVIMLETEIAVTEIA